MDVKICRICGESKSLSEFGSNGLGLKRTECKKCRNEYKRKKYAENIDSEHERMKVYRENNAVSITNSKIKYKSIHPERVKLSAHKTYINRRDHILEAQHNKYINNIDGYADCVKSSMRKLRNTGNLVLVDRKKRSNQRGLGFIPINEYFTGSVFHHLTNVYGVFIPKELHRSIYHSHVTNKGIVEINELALKWYSDFVKTELV